MEHFVKSVARTVTMLAVAAGLAGCMSAVGKVGDAMQSATTSIAETVTGEKVDRSKQTKVSENLDEVGGIVDVKQALPEEMGPIVDAAMEEHCVLNEIARAYGGQQMQRVAAVANTFVSLSLTAEQRANSIFCRPTNLGGVILMTDHTMNESLGAVGKGIIVAGRALKINEKAQNSLLQKLSRMRNMSIGEKMGPQFKRDALQMGKDIAVITIEVSKKLAVMKKTGAMNDAAKAQLIEAHKSFVTYKYYMTKAVAGLALIESQRAQHGTIALGRAFAQAIAYDLTSNRKSAKKRKKQKKQKQSHTVKLAVAFVGGIPKFIDSMSAGVEISDAIWEASDETAFQESLIELNKPPVEVRTELVEFSQETIEDTTTMGLPGIKI